MARLALVKSAAGLALGVGAGLFLTLGAPSRTVSQPVAVAAALPPAPADGQMGFVISKFVGSIVPGMKENCPAGFANTSRENYLEMVPASERARLSKPENEVELTQRWKDAAFGPNNTNICSNYDQFPNRPLQKIVTGKLAYGLDLDGGKTGDTCGHEEFVSPQGDTGIDNQVYRVFGCSRSWRGPDGGVGEMFQGQGNYLRTGEYKIVMLLRGIDSLIDDDDVEVIFASTEDQPMLDAQQNFLPGATFNVSANPRYRNVLRGRIDKGVLTAGPTDVVLARPVATGGPRAKRAEFDFARARLRFAFQADGTIEGLFAGYQPIFSLIHLQTNAGNGSATIVNMDCASIYNTMVKLADGGRDPATGRCTRLSSTMEISGVPAYVFDRPGAATRTAKLR